MNKLYRSRWLALYFLQCLYYTYATSCSYTTVSRENTISPQPIINELNEDVETQNDEYHIFQDIGNNCIYFNDHTHRNDETTHNHYNDKYEDEINEDSDKIFDEESYLKELKSNDNITTIYLAGYDKEIWKLKNDIQNKGEGDELLIYFFLYNDFKYINLGYAYTDVKYLQECLNKYSHYFCLEDKHLKPDWCLDEISVKYNTDPENEKYIHEQGFQPEISKLQINDNDLQKYFLQENIQEPNTNQEIDTNLAQIEFNNQDGVEDNVLNSVTCYPTRILPDKYEFTLPSENNFVGKDININLYKLNSEEQELNINNDKRANTTNIDLINPVDYNQDDISQEIVSEINPLEVVLRDYVISKLAPTTCLKKKIKYDNIKDQFSNTMGQKLETANSTFTSEQAKQIYIDKKYIEPCKNIEQQINLTVDNSLLKNIIPDKISESDKLELEENKLQNDTLEHNVDAYLPKKIVSNEEIKNFEDAIVDFDGGYHENKKNIDSNIIINTTDNGTADLVTANDKKIVYIDNIDDKKDYTLPEVAEDINKEYTIEKIEEIEKQKEKISRPVCNVNSKIFRENGSNTFSNTLNTITPNSLKPFNMSSPWSIYAGAKPSAYQDFNNAELSTQSDFLILSTKGDEESDDLGINKAGKFYIFEQVPCNNTENSTLSLKLTTELNQVTPNKAYLRPNFKLDDINLPSQKFYSNLSPTICSESYDNKYPETYSIWHNFYHHPLSYQFLRHRMPTSKKYFTPWDKMTYVNNLPLPHQNQNVSDTQTVTINMPSSFIQSDTKRPKALENIFTKKAEPIQLLHNFNYASTESGKTYINPILKHNRLSPNQKYDITVIPEQNGSENLFYSDVHPIINEELLPVDFSTVLRGQSDKDYFYNNIAYNNNLKDSLLNIKLRPNLKEYITKLDNVRQADNIKINILPYERNKYANEENFVPRYNNKTISNLNNKTKYSLLDDNLKNANIMKFYQIPDLQIKYQKPEIENSNNKYKQIIFDPTAYKIKKINYGTKPYVLTDTKSTNTQNLETIGEKQYFLGQKFMRPLKVTLNDLTLKDKIPLNISPEPNKIPDISHFIPNSSLILTKPLHTAQVTSLPISVSNNVPFINDTKLFRPFIRTSSYQLSNVTGVPELTSPLVHHYDLMRPQENIPLSFDYGLPIIFNRVFPEILHNITTSPDSDLTSSKDSVKYLNPQFSTLTAGPYQANNATNMCKIRSPFLLKNRDQLPIKYNLASSSNFVSSKIPSFINTNYIIPHLPTISEYVPTTTSFNPRLNHKSHDLSKLNTNYQSSSREYKYPVTSKGDSLITKINITHFPDSGVISKPNINDTKYLSPNIKTLPYQSSTSPATAPLKLPVNHYDRNQSLSYKAKLTENNLPFLFNRVSPIAYSRALFPNSVLDNILSENDRKFGEPQYENSAATTLPHVSTITNSPFISKMTVLREPLDVYHKTNYRPSASESNSPLPSISYVLPITNHNVTSLNVSPLTTSSSVIHNTNIKPLITSQTIPKYIPTITTSGPPLLHYHYHYDLSKPKIKYHPLLGDYNLPCFSSKGIPLVTLSKSRPIFKSSLLTDHKKNFQVKIPLSEFNVNPTSLRQATLSAIPTPETTNIAQSPLQLNFKIQSNPFKIPQALTSNEIPIQISLSQKTVPCLSYLWSYLDKSKPILTDFVPIKIKSTELSNRKIYQTFLTPSSNTSIYPYLSQSPSNLTKSSVPVQSNIKFYTFPPSTSTIDSIPLFKSPSMLCLSTKFMTRPSICPSMHKLQDQFSLSSPMISNPYILPTPNLSAKEHPAPIQYNFNFKPDIKADNFKYTKSKYETPVVELKRLNSLKSSKPIDSMTFFSPYLRIPDVSSTISPLNQLLSSINASPTFSPITHSNQNRMPLEMYSFSENPRYEPRYDHIHPSKETPNIKLPCSKMQPGTIPITPDSDASSVLPSSNVEVTSPSFLSFSSTLISPPISSTTPAVEYASNIQRYKFPVLQYNTILPTNLHETGPISSTSLKTIQKPISPHDSVLLKPTKVSFQSENIPYYTNFKPHLTLQDPVPYNKVSSSKVSNNIPYSAITKSIASLLKHKPLLIPSNLITPNINHISSPQKPNTINVDTALFTKPIITDKTSFRIPLNYKTNWDNISKNKLYSFPYKFIEELILTPSSVEDISQNTFSNLGKNILKQSEDSKVTEPPSVSPSKVYAPINTLMSNKFKLNTSPTQIIPSHLPYRPKNNKIPKVTTRFHKDFSNVYPSQDTPRKVDENFLPDDLKYAYYKPVQNNQDTTTFEFDKTINTNAIIDYLLKKLQRNNNFNANKEIITLPNLAFAKFEPKFDFKVTSDNSDIELVTWLSKLKVYKAKIVLEGTEVNAMNFMPIVRKGNYCPKFVEKIVERYVRKYYGNPVILIREYSFYKPYAYLYDLNESSRAYLIWPIYRYNYNM